MEIPVQRNEKINTFDVIVQKNDFPGFEKTSFNKAVTSRES